MDPRTDADIILASQNEPSNFAQIFERHYEAIFGFAARRLGVELADDVAADTFVIALRRIDSYDTDYASALPWLYGIVRNVIQNHWRSEKRRLRLIAEIGDHEEADNRALGPEERVDVLDTSASIASGLLQLNEVDRDALLLFVWAGLPQSEIARLQEVPEGTVRSRIHRSRRVLREHLAVTEQLETEGSIKADDGNEGER